MEFLLIIICCSKSLSALDRAALLLDAYALAKAKLAPIDTVVEVLRFVMHCTDNRFPLSFHFIMCGYLFVYFSVYSRALVNEHTYTAWSAISVVLTALSQLMEKVGGPAYEAFKVFGKNMVVAALKNVSFIRN